ncbi:MAG: glycosyltransferase family 2 protein, partial [Candidatus Latescibacterota bacterium]
MNGPGEDRKVRLSIVFVGYNTRDLLVDALRSIDAHPSAYETEIVVVDNASS